MEKITEIYQKLEENPDLEYYFLDSENNPIKVEKIEKDILEILKKDREGITISEMVEKLKVHRHTLTKYIYRLEGERKIKIRKIGIAKLCYLNSRK